VRGKALSAGAVVLLLAVLGSLAVVFLDLRQMSGYFFADEAVYYAMGLSAARDLDLEYTREDLLRINRLGWVNGPQGVLLSRNPERGRIYFAKPMLHALAAAPFVRLFGGNGFLVFNVLCLALAVHLSVRFLSRYMSERVALRVSLVFHLLCVAPVYVFWIHPEMFNYALLTAGLFSFLQYDGPRGPRSRRYYLAPVLFGLGAYSRLPMVLFAGPQLVAALVRRRFRDVGICLVLLAGSYGAMVGLHRAFTGMSNPYAGDRKIFYGHFPEESPEVRYEDLGSSWSTKQAKFHFLGNVFLANCGYFFVGRHSGMLLYYFTAMLGVLGLLQGPRSLERWLVALAVVGSILALIVMIPTNYHGGSGTIGNRYFMAVFPAFLFLMAGAPSGRRLWTIGLISGAFTLQLFTGPFQFSFRPALVAENLPFRLFPIEKTLVDSLPYQGPARTRVFFGEGKILGYFVNGGAYGRDGKEDAFWLEGGRTAELLLVTRERPKVFVFTIVNGGAPENTFRLDGDVQRVEERGLRPWESRDVIAVVTSPLRFQTHFGNFKHVTLVRMKADKGMVLKYHGGPQDGRYLGIRVLVRTDRFTIARALMEKSFLEDAVELLRAEVKDYPRDPSRRSYLITALERLGRGSEAAALRRAAAEAEQPSTAAVEESP
jgi:hypothetical protein